MKINAKFLIVPTNKNMEADQNTRTESIYDMDSSSNFGKNLPKKNTIVDGIPAIEEQNEEAEEVSNKQLLQDLKQ